MMGYRLSLQFSDTYAFRERSAIPEETPWHGLHQAVAPNMTGTPRSEVQRCPTCGAILEKWNDPLTDVVVKKRYFDISITYDGVTIVSDRFKTVYESNGLSGLWFVPLPSDSSFFSIRATHVVPFDTTRRRTRFINQCITCGQFESVVGATPVFLKEGATVPDWGFVRTDVEFGSNDEKHPLLICGQSAGNVLSNAKLKGLDLVEL